MSAYTGRNVKSRLIRATGSDYVFHLINYVVLTLFLCIIIYPLYWVLLASISDPNMINRGEIVLVPKGFFNDGYKALLEYPAIWRSYINTIYYTVLGMVFNVTVTILAGYGLSRPNMPFRKIIMRLLIFTMFFSGGLIPMYMLVRNLKLLDTVWALILPSTLSIYNITVSRAFFQGSIPDGIVEAAQIDGCSNLGTFFRIVLPVSPAIISVMCLFHVVFRWNEYFSAMLYFSSSDKYPLQLIMREILISARAMANQIGAGATTDPRGLQEMQRQAQLIRYSSIIISTVPMLVLYPFLQKYFVKGIMVGSLKG